MNLLYPVSSLDQCWHALHCRFLFTPVHTIAAPPPPPHCCHPSAQWCCHSSRATAPPYLDFFPSPRPSSPSPPPHQIPLVVGCSEVPIPLPFVMDTASAPHDISSRRAFELHENFCFPDLSKVGMRMERGGGAQLEELMCLYQTLVSGVQG